VDDLLIYILDPLSVLCKEQEILNLLVKALTNKSTSDLEKE
jgi:hypothetical protein